MNTFYDVPEQSQLQFGTADGVSLRGGGIHHYRGSGAPELFVRVPDNRAYLYVESTRPFFSLDF